MTDYVTITSDKSRALALLLCALGLIGLAGFHRFYTGRWFTGIIWFCTGGLLFVGTAIDLLLILVGLFRDNSRAPLRKW